MVATVVRSDHPVNVTDEVKIMTSAQSDVKEYSYFADNRWRKAADNQRACLAHLEADRNGA
jgi:hypothetical protein